MLKTEKIKTSKIKSNPDNPRIIKDDRFKGLVQSIKEFPEMLELRPIVVDKDLMVLGGNMRLKACKELKLKDVYITKADNLTDEQKKEFIIKDNASFGDWNYSQLGEWDNEQLIQWGLEMWKNDTDDIININASDENSEWVGMPDFEAKEGELKLIITFKDDKIRKEFVEKYKLKLSNSKGITWSTTYPFIERRDLQSLKYE